jgi:hypothetical protein
MIAPRAALQHDLFCAAAFILIMGWAVYVLPKPGDRLAWELASRPIN